MWRDAHVVGREAGPQTSDAADLDLLHGAIDRALEWHLTGHRIGLRLLDLCLDIVERQREEGGEEAGDGGRAEGLSGSRDADRLELVLRQAVEAQHAEVQSHRTGRGRHGTLEETCGTLGLDDVRQGMPNSGVVPALRQRKHGVGLHPDERQIGGVADDRSDAAGAQGACRGLPEGHLLALHRGGLREDVEEAEAGPGVEHLACEARAEALVKAADSLLAEQLLGDLDGAGAAALGAADLDAHLDHVHGLDAAGGQTAREAAGDEGLGCLPYLGHGCSWN
mmetsp:Transcript_127560/g.407986  ORF Transcript_127560/g.407986 Transcript_127560/m.407986 type:complete len:280 (-) Transcript_127560:57-896(-)